jgi:hypothetical protein
MAVVGAESLGGLREIAWGVCTRTGAGMGGRM